MLDKASSNARRVSSDAVIVLKAILSRTDGCERVVVVCYIFINILCTAAVSLFLGAVREYEPIK